MGDLNKVMLIGNLTKQPETKTTPSGKSVSTFSIATNRSWTDNGVKKETAEFHNCIAWGKLADIIGKYCTKGMKVYVEGRLATTSWDDQNGAKKFKTEIIVENLLMLSKNESPKKEQEELPIVNADDDEEINLEDIPF